MNIMNAHLTTLARPAWLPQSVWPVQTDRLLVDRHSIAVTDVGCGPVLLFVHTGFWSFVWRDVILRLSSDFRCVCFDAPGTGRSGGPTGVSESLQDASRALEAVVGALELEDITLVVHDLGGPSGIAGAARMADRIRGIAAVNAFAWKPSGTVFRSMLAFMGSAPIREFDALTQILPRITATTFGVGRHMNEASRRAFRAGIGPQGARAFHNYLRDARNADDLYDEVETALAGVFRKHPVLTVFGERNDPLGFQPRWKALFPDAVQVVVPKGNHFPMCDAPDMLAAALSSWHRERVASKGRPLVEKLRAARGGR
jgi:pimeloyl-ACP methyl ester carboxylesterase